MIRNLHLIATACAALVMSLHVPAAANPVSDFYDGKSARMIVSTATGGSYDTSARLIARHLSRHTPGAPNFVVQNMVGASGRLAANYMANIAPRDGSVLFAPLETVALAQLMRESGIEYDVRQFNWIGTPYVPALLLVAWHTAGIRSLAETRTKEITIGAAGSSGAILIYPSLFNALFHTKLKIIAGYAGGNDLNLAMEREEIQGRGGLSWNLLNSEKPEWIRDKKIVILAQMSMEKHPELQDVPDLAELADNPDARRVLGVMTASSSFGRPIATAPGVPADRVASLRKAFDDVMKDEIFLSDATQRHVEIDPKSGEQLQKIANDIMSAPEKDVEFIKAALHGRGVVRCETFTDPKNCEKSKKD